jgi:hypothetical protein
LAENSISAGARRVQISIREDLREDLFEIDLKDDGRGMDPDMASKALNPFVTTRTTRRVGLGLSLLADAARAAGGDLELESEVGVGTHVRAYFQHKHIDRKPLGDMGSTMMSLILADPEIEYVYEHRRNGESFCLDTREIRQELDPVPLSQPEVLQWIRENVQEGLREIGALEG